MTTIWIYDLPRTTRRDGVPMWPERIKNSLTPYSDGNREIDAAEARRTSPAAPAPQPKKPSLPHAPRPYGTGKRRYEMATSP